MTLNRPDSTKELTYCVLISTTNDVGSVSGWFETNAEAQEHARGVMQEATDEKWGKTKVYVLQLLRTGEVE